MTGLIKVGRADNETISARGRMLNGSVMPVVIRGQQ